MMKSCGSVATLLMTGALLVAPASASEPYTPSRDWHVVSFELIEINKSPEGAALKLYFTATDAFTVTEADSSTECVGGRWRDLYNVLDRDDNGVIRISTEECGNNLILCASVNEMSTAPDASAPDDYGICVPVAW